MKQVLSSVLKSNFPPVNYATVYGSFFNLQQKNQQTPENTQNQQIPIIDVMLIVEDTEEFHHKNMELNQRHYGYIPKRLPPSVTSHINKSYGAGIYYNPPFPLQSFKNDDLITEIDDFSLRYGVISEKDALHDLHTWESFALASKFQQPLLPLIEHEDPLKQIYFEEALEQNLKNALYLTLFMNFHNQTPITSQQLFTSLYLLHCHGSPQTSLITEDSVEIEVQKNLTELAQMYLPHLLEIQSQKTGDKNKNPFKFTQDGKLQFIKTQSGLQKLFDGIPDELKAGMKRSVVQLSLAEMQEDVKKHLGVKVYHNGLTSAVQSVYGGRFTDFMAYIRQRRMRKKLEKIKIKEQEAEQKQQQQF